MKMTMVELSEKYGMEREEWDKSENWKGKLRKENNGNILSVMDCSRWCEWTTDLAATTFLRYRSDSFRNFMSMDGCCAPSYVAFPLKQIRDINEIAEEQKRIVSMSTGRDERRPIWDSKYVGMGINWNYIESAEGDEYETIQ